MRALIEEIATLPSAETFGRVSAVQGLLLEVARPVPTMRTASRVDIADAADRPLSRERVAFRTTLSNRMPFPPLDRAP